MKDPQTVINDYLTDMVAVEKHVLEAVERQLAGDELKRYAEANRVVAQLRTVLQQHIQTLEAKIQAREGGTIKDTVKQAVTGALGVVAGLYDKVRTDKVSRMLRDDYTATHFACVSYTMLHTTALGLKNQEVASLAVRHLKDLTPLCVDLSKVVCHVVAEELAAENKVFDGSVGPQAVSNTQEAWSGSFVTSHTTA